MTRYSNWIDTEYRNEMSMNNDINTDYFYRASRNNDDETPADETYKVIIYCFYFIGAVSNKNIKVIVNEAP